MSSIKVLAGDIDKGKWNFMGAFGTATMSRASTSSSILSGESYDLISQAQSLEIMDEEKVKTLSGTAGWGFVGAVALGPLGAVGGMLLGGNKKEVTFSCQLSGGKKFLATTDSKTWKKILAAKF